MTQTLDALRAQFGSDKEEKTTTFVTNYYPFWNMKTGERAIIRFLPDVDQNNPRGFLVEKVFHNLVINGKKKMVPCLSMYGEECPICKVSQAYYKAKDEANGKKYWRKKQYIAQALVVEDPLPADEEGHTHQGEVRFFALGFQIYNIIKEAFAATDDGLESIPYNFHDGYDFIIKKSEKGGYADYSVGTKFFSRQRGLTEHEIDVATKQSINISTLLPKNPGAKKIQAMLDADLNGEDYNDDDSSDGDGFSNNKPSSPPPPPAAPRSPTTKTNSVPDDADLDAMLAAVQARRSAMANKKTTSFDDIDDDIPY